MTILDTNVWVAYLNTGDAQHAKAARLLAKHAWTQLVIPEYVIVETTTILAQRASKQTADRFLEYVLDNRDVTVLFAYRELFDQAVLAFQRQRSKRLSFVDTALLTLANEYKVITFDTALARAIKQRAHR